MKKTAGKQTSRRLHTTSFGESGVLRPSFKRTCSTTRLPNNFSKTSPSSGNPNAIPGIRFCILSEIKIAASTEKLD
jgi:hypothetical protein